MAGSPAPLPVDAAVQHCRAITHRSRNNLALAAGRFDEPARERLFVVTYASMRVIDDYVDELFLCRPFPERKRERAAVLDQLDRIADQVRACADGSFRPGPTAFEPVVFSALNQLLPATGLGARPWETLVEALRRDVRERPVQTWEEYLEYCEGACVAPAEVFVHVTACDATSLRTDLPQPLAWYARPLAVFSYLAHMLRDLEEDAHGAPQIYPVPRAVIVEAGLSIDEARRASRQRQWAGLQRMLVAISREAGRWRDRARSRLEEAQGHLDPRAWEILDEIAWMYERALLDARRDQRV